MLKTNQRFGKFILIVFSLLFAFNGNSIANAAIGDNDKMVPYYTDIKTCSGKISISGVKANCVSSLTTKKLQISK